MSNLLEKYLNNNYKKAINSLSIKKAQTKDGSEYYFLNIEFINGYNHRVFLKDAEQFGVCSAFDRLDDIKPFEEN